MHFALSLYCWHLITIFSSFFQYAYQPSHVFMFFNVLFLHLQVDEDDFKEEQYSVARLIQMLHNDDPEEMYKVYDLLQHEHHVSF